MSRDPYYEVFKHLSVALFVQDAESGRLLLVNPSACELYRLTEDEVRQGWPGILVDDRQMQVDPNEAILQAQHGPPVAVEWPARRTDGSTFWASLRFRANTTGDKRLVFVEAHDVSTRRSAMRALAASERDLDETHRMLRSILDAIPTRVFWKDRESRYLGCNEIFAQDAGVDTPRDIVGLDDFDLPWHTEAPLYLKDDQAVVAEAKGRFGYQEPQTRADDRVAWLRTNKVPLEDAQGQIMGVLGTYDDITEQRANMEALRNREADLRITLDSIGDGVISTDNSGLVRRMNPVAERLTGWSEEQALGQPLKAVYQLFDADSRTPVMDPITRARAGGSVDITQSVVLRGRDGRERHIVDSGSEIRDSGAHSRGVVVAFRDVSEARALQDQLQQAKQMEAVGDLAGGVAHDFNNLLQVILGAASFVLEEMQAQDSNRELLQDVLDAAERASTLTRQMLIFARREPPRLRSLSLNQTVEGVVTVMRRVAGELIEVKLELQDGLPEVRADEHQLELALLSLCLNARAVMPQGGVVRVMTSQREINEAEAARHPGAGRGRYVALAVRDEGPGVDPEHLSRLFEPFFTVNPEGHGTGLGLASVDAVAQVHGGFVDMETLPGAGAQFTLHIPVAEGPAAEGGRRPISEPRGPRVGHARILLAEDTEPVRNQAARALKKAGYTVVEACDGQEAEELFLAEPSSFDAVILDVVMPRKDGQAVFRTIKEVRPELPVLFSSAYAVTVLEPGATEQTHPHLLQKPYVPGTLLAKLEELL